MFSYVVLRYFASESVLFPSSFSPTGFYCVGFNEADGDMTWVFVDCDLLSRSIALLLISWIYGRSESGERGGSVVICHMDVMDMSSVWIVSASPDIYG